MTQASRPSGPAQSQARRALAGTGFGFLAYACFASGDSLVKAVGPELGVFAIGFYATVFSSSVLLVVRRPGERFRDMLRPKNPLLVHLRALMGIVAGFFAVYAFTHLPFADAYALIFLMPVFVAILSRFALGERGGWRRWLPVALGLLGILVAVRPGFRDLGPGHLAAALVAVCGAITVVILRRIAGEERPTTLMATILLYGLTLNGLLMLADVRVPAGWQLLCLAGAGCLSAAGQLALYAATARAPAARVGATQYSQILWAVLIGAAFFGEVPDAITAAGLGLVLLSGLATLRLADRPGSVPVERHDAPAFEDAAEAAVDGLGRAPAARPVADGHHRGDGAVAGVRDIDGDDVLEARPFRAAVEREPGPLA